MGFGGVNGAFQAATLESAYPISTPFIAEARVSGLDSHGSTFIFAVASQDGTLGVAVTGNLNQQNSPGYGINMFTGTGTNSPWTEQPQIFLTPSTGTWYNIWIYVEPNGCIFVNVTTDTSSLGESPSSSPGGCYQMGKGSYYVLLGQAEGEPMSMGPNQALWAYTTVVQPVIANSCGDNLTPYSYVSFLLGLPKVVEAILVFFHLVGIAC